MDTFEILRDSLIEFNSYMDMVYFNTCDLIFQERVYLKCFYCSKYDTTWTCPPRIPKLDFQKIVLEYQHSAVVICKMDVRDEQYDEIRYKSTNELHKSLLYLEKILWQLNNPMVISFIGGSCKLCKNGCDENKCRNPGMKRVAIEAIGVNVIQSLKKIDIHIDFREKEVFHRFGLILW